MGAYETAAVQLFKSLVNPGDRVFDIGANIGFHTMWLSKLVGSTGQVSPSNRFVIFMMP